MRMAGPGESFARNEQKRFPIRRTGTGIAKPTARRQGMPARRVTLAVVAALSFHGVALAVPGKADFARERPAPAAREIGDWVVASHDNGASAFFIIDKREARLYVFDPGGRLQGAAPVLLGLAHGDDSFPGIGEKRLTD